MEEVLNNITYVLDFCLNTFTLILDWSLSNSVLAMSIYIPLALFLIALVFKLISNLFNNKKEE